MGKIQVKQIKMIDNIVISKKLRGYRLNKGNVVCPPKKKKII